MKNLLILTLALLTISCCKEEEEYFNISGTYELIDKSQVSEGWSDVILLNDYGYPPDENGYRGGAIRFVTTEGKEILYGVNIRAFPKGNGFIMEFTSLLDVFYADGEINHDRTGEMKIELNSTSSHPFFQYNGPIKKL